MTIIHFFSTMGEREESRTRGEIGKWVFERADWKEFKHLSEDNMSIIDTDGNIDHGNSLISAATIMAAEKSIPRSKGRIKKENGTMVDGGVLCGCQENK